MGIGSVNTGYPVKVNTPGGVVGIGNDGKIPEELIPDVGGGFVEMTTSIPVSARKLQRLYAHIIDDFSGTSNG